MHMFIHIHLHYICMYIYRVATCPIIGQLDHPPAVITLPKHISWGGVAVRGVAVGMPQRRLLHSNVEYKSTCTHMLAALQ